MIKLYLFHCLDGARSEYEFVRRLGVINFVLAIIEMVLLALLHNIWGQNQNRWKKRHIKWDQLQRLDTRKLDGKKVFVFPIYLLFLYA